MGGPRDAIYWSVFPVSTKRLGQNRGTVGHSVGPHNYFPPPNQPRHSGWGSVDPTILQKPKFGPTKRVVYHYSISTFLYRDLLALETHFYIRFLASNDPYVGPTANYPSYFPNAAFLDYTIRQLLASVGISLAPSTMSKLPQRWPNDVRLLYIPRYKVAAE